MELNKVGFEINRAADEIIKLIHNQFHIDEDIAEIIYDKQVKQYVDRLIDGLFFIAETNYIDRFYRDSYYAFFSKKLDSYNKNCIRISVFNTAFDIDDCLETNDFTIIEDNYLGFFVLRPTIPQVIGRSVFSPKAFINNKFDCCLTEFQTSVYGIKLKVNAYPLASQDRETITCAETTLWAVMEYFSHKYPEYKPTLPSHIIATLNSVSHERQLPSRGLNIQQISYALKEFGFGSMIYMQKEFNGDFFRALNIYLDSGIPVIIAIENEKAMHIGNQIRHALVGIGLAKSEENLSVCKYGSMYSDKLESELQKVGLKILDFSDINRQIVTIDDNLPAYSLIDKDSPGSNYSNSSWHSCKITGMIVPLHHKINLDALMAKEVICSFLAQEYKVLMKNGDIILRTFLASSRTYKNYIAKNPSLNPKVKNKIIKTPMPKFIYVGETTNRSTYRENYINGMVIADATESNVFNNKPVIIAVIDKELLLNDINGGKFQANDIDLQSFECFNYNIK